ncbi:MAG: alpha-E domain-containing protein [Chloroflexi bacterium]|nr:alpha-E domain-containing protein [Chloroflexota bacterium]
MLCRVAEDLFWTSRYVERAIAVSRLSEVTWHLELDAGDVEDEHGDFWAPLLGPADEAPTRLRGDEHPSPDEVRHYLIFDGQNPSSLVSCVRQARSAARGVRESISSEMWEHLNTLYLSLVDPDLAAQAEDNPHGFYKRIREGAQFFQGLTDSTLAHDEVWHFTGLGKYLERADNVARVLSLQAHLLLTGEHGDDLVRWLAVLRSCGSAEAYARYYSLRVEPARVVEFLLLNPIFPQSVRFSLGAAWEALRAIGASQGISHDSATRASRALGMLSAQLEHAAVDEVLEDGLQPYLTSIRNQIAEISEHVTRGYLRDEPRPGRLVAVARAAMIMAAQQQQQ